MEIPPELLSDRKVPEKKIPDLFETLKESIEKGLPPEESLQSTLKILREKKDISEETKPLPPPRGWIFEQERRQDELADTYSPPSQKDTPNNH